MAKTYIIADIYSNSIHAPKYEGVKTVFVEVQDGGNYSEEEVTDKRGRDDTLVLDLCYKEFQGKWRYHYQVSGENRWTMFGGSFVYTSDSRFQETSQYPIPLHDRVEG